MKKSKYKILSLLYNPDRSYTKTELLNTAHDLDYDYSSLSDDLNDLLNNGLVKYRDLVHDIYTPLELTTKGRHIYEQETESRKKSHKQTIYKVISVVIAALAALAAVISLFQ